ncbi:hypothetical protein Q2T70_26485 [Klebsiella oxytoca]|uniref:hypothetical protein n=1 Tax=Klebsiella oxytoca TaxID=571 RepID=UPI00265F2B1C|nr:hypothetical protein [Klebsiella oxytoca]WKM71864.1 hypothetical protein Q2T70_26485 [Klebsiella oxytoca]
MSKPVILEALEEIGPCDAETLAGHLNQSAAIVNAMLVKFIRGGLVKSASGMFSLTDKGRLMHCGNDKGACPANSAPCKDSAPVVQPSAPGVVAARPADSAAQKGIVHPTSKGVCTTDATQDKGCGQIVHQETNDDKPAVSKAERLRRILQDQGTMTSGELAAAGSVPVNYINGLLKGDVKAGRVTLRKRDGKSVYQWVGKEPPKPVVRQSDVTPNRDGVTSPATDSVITVPTSKALAQELHNLDNEMIKAKTKYDSLVQERRRKGELLLIVEKLENHLEGVAE